MSIALTPKLSIKDLFIRSEEVPEGEDKPKWLDQLVKEIKEAVAPKQEEQTPPSTVPVPPAPATQEEEEEEETPPTVNPLKKVWDFLM